MNKPFSTKIIVVKSSENEEEAKKKNQCEELGIPYKGEDKEELKCRVTNIMIDLSNVMYFYENTYELDGTTISTLDLTFNNGEYLMNVVCNFEDFKKAIEE